MIDLNNKYYEHNNYLVSIILVNNELIIKIIDVLTYEYFSKTFSYLDLSYEPVQIYNLLNDFFENKNPNIKISMEEILLDNSNITITINMITNYYIINTKLLVTQIDIDTEKIELFIKIKNLNKINESLNKTLCLKDELINSEAKIINEINDKLQIKINEFDKLKLLCLNLLDIKIFNISIPINVNNLWIGCEYNKYLDIYSDKYKKIDIILTYNNSIKKSRYHNIIIKNIYLASLIDHNTINDMYPNVIYKSPTQLGCFDVCCISHIQDNKYYEEHIKKIPYLYLLDELTINCFYIPKFQPEIIPTSIKNLTIYNYDQEILYGLDHLISLNKLTLIFNLINSDNWMANFEYYNNYIKENYYNLIIHELSKLKILKNISNQLKKLKENSPNLIVELYNYNELVNYDKELGLLEYIILK